MPPPAPDPTPPRLAFPLDPTDPDLSYMQLLQGLAEELCLLAFLTLGAAERERGSDAP